MSLDTNQEHGSLQLAHVGHKPSETAMMASWATASNRMRFGLKREMGLGESEARSWVMSSHISPYQEPRQRRGWCLRP